MNVRESVGIALDALRANRLRSSLTLLGVVIGVSSVIAVMSLVQGLNRYVGAQLVTQGADVFNVDLVGNEFDFQKVIEKSRRRKLTVEDAEAIARAAPHVQAAIAGLTDFMNVRRSDHVLRNVDVHGVQAGYMDIDDYPVASGRPIGEEDDRGSGNVCVLGADVADQLFGSLDPIGRDVRIDELRCTVIGVGDHLGSSFGSSRDLYALIPLRTFLRLRGRDRSVNLSVKSRGQEAFVTAQDEARAILRARRHVRPAEPDDFELSTPEMVLSLWKNLSGAIFAVIVGVASVSLVVGGIVIMNIMLVSVTERTREIGVRKALGATRRDVLGQFLIEATTLSIVGGVIGLVLGAGFALLLGLVTPLPVYISPLAIVLGLATSSAVGVFFGAYPASRAARLDPIESLRYE